MPALITTGDKNKLRSIGFGLDASVSFRFNAREISPFTLRQSGNQLFVQSYIDEQYSKFTVSQPTNANQPEYKDNGVYFNGANQFLTNNFTYTAREIWSVVQYDLALAKNFDGIVTGQDLSYLLILNQNTTSLFVNNSRNTNGRVNNVLTTVLLPTETPKTASVEVPIEASNANQITIGRDRFFTIRGWQGFIYDVIIFNKVLNITEKIFLYDYLLKYHNLCQH